MIRSLASSTAPEHLNRSTLYDIFVLKIGPETSRIACDSLAFEVALRRPETSPIIFGCSSRLEGGRPPFLNLLKRSGKSSRK